MTGTALREVLHEVAAGGVGPVDDSRLVRLADAARGLGPSPSAPRRGGRGRWVVGGLALGAAAVLAVIGAVQVLGPAEVTPASGSGSLPDRIFPTRERILTLEQAPIGRVSMVYSGPILDGQTGWVAVGADSDEYRGLAPASTHLQYDANVDVAPDGSAVAVGRGGAREGDLAVDFIDISSGQTEVVALPDEGAGGRIDSLLWGTNKDHVGVLASVTDPADPDRSSGRVRCFVVDTRSGDVVTLPRRAALVGEMAGWSPDGKLLLVDEPYVSEAGLETVIVSAADSGGVTQVAKPKGLQTGFSRASISPDGQLLSGLVDPTPSSSGDGSVWDLQVYDLASGKQVLNSNLSSFAEDMSKVIGWRDSTTPVLSAVLPGADELGLLIAYDVTDGTEDVMVRAGAAGVPGYYMTSRVAADVLASGDIRVATPPHQPWYDLRTAWPGDVVVGLVFVLAVIGGFVIWARVNRRS